MPSNASSWTVVQPTIPKMSSLHTKIGFYIYQPNGGLSSARRCGIRNSTGRYIALLDCDDRFKPGKLRYQVAALDHNPDVVFVHSNATVVDGNGDVISASLWEKEKGRCQPFADAIKNLFSGNFTIAGTVMFRRDALDCAGMFDETLDCCEDYEYWLRLPLGGKSEYIDEKLLSYVWHGNNMCANLRKMVRGKIEAPERFIPCRPKAVAMLGENWCNGIIRRRTRELGHSLWSLGDGRCAREIYQYGSSVAGANATPRRLWIKSFVPKKLKDLLKRT